MEHEYIEKEKIMTRRFNFGIKGQTLHKQEREDVIVGTKYKMTKCMKM